MLDFFVVLITIASYFLQSSNLNSIKTFRLIKILRPLRAISKNQRMKLSLRALGIALPDIFSVIIISLLFIYILAVISVNYFKGLLYECLPNESLKLPMVNKWDCLNSGGQWKNFYMNFDNTLQAMSTLFIISNSV
jgi:hypothetical protein